MSANGSGKKQKKRSKPADEHAQVPAADAGKVADSKDSKTPTKAGSGATASSSSSGSSGGAAGVTATHVNAEMSDAGAASGSGAEGRKVKKAQRTGGKKAANETPVGLEPESLEDLPFEDENPDDVDSEDERIIAQVEKMRLEGKKIGDEADDSDEDAAAVAAADKLKTTGELRLPKKPAKAPTAGTAAPAQASASSSGSAAMDDTTTAGSGGADADGDEDDDDDDDDDGAGASGSRVGGSNKRQPQPKVWRPVDGMADGEQLEYDAKFYSCYHALRADWPCLSFDIIRDRMGDLRTKWPATLYLATGTQAERGADNKILIMKVSDIHRTKHDDDDPDEDEDDDGVDDEDHTDDDPLLATHTIDCDGEVNRIRAMPQLSNFLASWHSTGKVHIWDASKQLASLDKDGPGTKKIPTVPIFTFQHTYEEKIAAKGRGGGAAAAGRSVRKPAEGFALDWCPTAPGRLASGDHKAGLHVWEYRESTWVVDGAFHDHTGSIEDIQWSPNEPNVFATCSADLTIRIWDTRQSNKKSIRFVVAHKEDVNVISWNKKTPAFLVSGSDDCSVKIWDFRKFTSNSAIAQFKYHTKPITSVEWHPHEDSVFAASSADDSVSVWDLALERDADFKAEGAALDEKEYPPQLYFVHQGQHNIKEVHFHPQIPAMMLSTAEDGFNIFKPSNMELTGDQLKNLAQPYKATAAAPPPASAATAAAGAAAAAAVASAAATKKA